MFDFEIYVEIDVYSRYIIWIYVDVTAHTTLNVYK